MSINKGKIGNALESVAPDHVVAVANDIFDETLNKYQSELNQQIGQAGQGTVKGAKVGSGSTISPDENGIVTLPNYTENATPHIAPSSTEVKNALGTITISTGKYLKDDGTWETPPNTTYQSKDATSGGSDVSLVTTGEKYTWNAKADLSTVNARLDEQDAEIALLTSGDVIVVDTLPSTGTANKIYRVQGTDSYVDWMYDNGSWKKIATYSFPGIDDTPSRNSEKLVKSGGVYDAVFHEGDNITLSQSGFYDSNKGYNYLDTWKCDEISFDNCDGIYIDVRCDGAAAYSYILDGNGNVLKQWNNVNIAQTVLKKSYPTADRLLLSCRAEYSSEVRKIFTQSSVCNNNLKGTIDSFIKKDWKLHGNMSIDLNGNIVGNNVPSNNTAISFNLANRNVWWIRAHLNNNGKELVNAGLVVSENTIGKSFRMMKAAFRAAGTVANTTIDFYSHPRSSFEEYKRIVESSTLKGDECVLSMAISGCVCAGYLNDQFVGYQKFDKVDGNSKTLFGGVLMSNDIKAFDISFGTRQTPYAHFSLDDIGRIMRTISLSNLTSIFDNEMFAFLKDMHEKYGLCITLNLFYSIIVDGSTWTLANFPDTFKTELQANSSWLKFSFHGGDESIRYNEESNNSAAIAACNNTLNEIARFAGEASIDYMIRPTFFSGNKTLLVSLRSAGNLLGCLTADDARESNCGLTATERACVYTSSDYIDFERGLYYIKSAPRFDTQTTEQVKAMVLSNVSDTCRNMVFEYFTHAVDTISSKDRASIEEALKILVANQVRMDFAQNNLPL